MDLKRLKSLKDSHLTSREFKILWSRLQEETNDTNIFTSNPNQPVDLSQILIRLSTLEKSMRYVEGMCLNAGLDQIDPLAVPYRAVTLLARELMIDVLTSDWTFETPILSFGAHEINWDKFDACLATGVRGPRQDGDNQTAWNLPLTPIKSSYFGFQYVLVSISSSELPVKWDCGDQVLEVYSDDVNSCTNVKLTRSDGVYLCMEQMPYPLTRFMSYEGGIEQDVERRLKPAIITFVLDVKEKSIRYCVSTSRLMFLRPRRKVVWDWIERRVVVGNLSDEVVNFTKFPASRNVTLGLHSASPDESLIVRETICCYLSWIRFTHDRVADMPLLTIGDGASYASMYLSDYVDDLVHRVPISVTPKYSLSSSNGTAVNTHPDVRHTVIMNAKPITLPITKAGVHARVYQDDLGFIDVNAGPLRKGEYCASDIPQRGYTPPKVRSVDVYGLAESADIGTTVTLSCVEDPNNRIATYGDS